MIRLLFWTSLVIVYTIAGGGFIQLFGVKPAVFLAFVVAVSFRRWPLPAVCISFLLLFCVRAVLMPADSRGDLAAFFVLAVMLPAAGKYVRVQHFIEFVVYFLFSFALFLVIIVTWAKIVGKRVPLPGAPAVLFTMIYTLLLSSVFFMVIPAAKESR